MTIVLSKAWADEVKGYCSGKEEICRGCRRSGRLEPRLFTGQGASALQVRSSLLPQRQRAQHRLLLGDQRVHALAGEGDHLG
jgi:hypothetical protein